jgi:hypothetical protein
VTTQNSVIDDEEIFDNIIPDNSDNRNNPGFKVKVILAYTRPYSDFKDADIIVSVFDSHNRETRQNLDLSNYRIDGTPITTTFTFYNHEIPVGKSGEVCVSNDSSRESENLPTTCRTFVNGPEHEPEQVRVVIPH